MSPAPSALSPATSDTAFVASDAVKTTGDGSQTTGDAAGAPSDAVEMKRDTAPSKSDSGDGKCYAVKMKRDTAPSKSDSGDGKSYAVKMTGDKHLFTDAADRRVEFLALRGTRPRPAGGTEGVGRKEASRRRSSQCPSPPVLTIGARSQHNLSSKQNCAKTAGNEGDSGLKNRILAVHSLRHAGCTLGA